MSVLRPVAEYGCVALTGRMSEVEAEFDALQGNFKNPEERMRQASAIRTLKDATGMASICQFHQPLADLRVVVWQNIQQELKDCRAGTLLTAIDYAKAFNRT